MILRKVGQVFRFNADLFEALGAFHAEAAGVGVCPGGAVQTQLVLFFPDALP